MDKSTNRFILAFLLAALAIVVFNTAAVAQDENLPSVNPVPSSVCSIPSSLKTQQVIASSGRNEPVKMGDRIRIQILGLSDAVRNASSDEPFDPRDLVLYLNGYELKNVHGEPTLVTVRDRNQTRVDSDWLAFRLERTEASESTWNALLGGSPKRSINAIVGVGCPDQIAIPVVELQNPPQLEVILLSWRFVLSLILFLVVLYIFFRFCRDTLRSSGVENICFVREENRLILRGPSVPKNKRGRLQAIFLGEDILANKNPFSLSASQLAWWTFLIFGSYLLIYGITGDYTNILTNQSLTLLGINAATALGTSLIDGRGSEIERKGSRRISGGFFQDVLSDINGVNFQRFQMFIWTAAIGLFFIWEVFKNLAMPEFDGTLLALQGISAVTFLGFRGQEIHGETRESLNAKVESSAGQDAQSLGEDLSDTSQSELAEVSSNKNEQSLGIDNS